MSASQKQKYLNSNSSYLKMSYQIHNINDKLMLKKGNRTELLQRKKELSSK